MNRQQTSVEYFATNVELIKKHIIFNIKLIKKSLRDLNKPNGDKDKDAILANIVKAREKLEKYRLALDDLACAYVRSHKSESEKIWKHFKYKSAEGFLMDRDTPDKPSLDVMIKIVSRSHQIPLIYEFKYENGERIVERHQSFWEEASKPYTPGTGDMQAIEKAVNSSIRHR